MQARGSRSAGLDGAAALWSSRQHGVSEAAGARRSCLSSTAAAAAAGERRRVRGSAAFSAAVGHEVAAGREARVRLTPTSSTAVQQQQQQHQQRPGGVLAG